MTLAYSAPNTPRQPNILVRVVLGFFVFAVLLCGYIVLPPVAEWPQRMAVARQALQPDPEVTRSDLFAGEALLADAPLVTAQAVEVEARTTAQLLAELAARPALDRVRTDESNLQDTTAGVLSALGLQEPQSAPASDDPMFSMTANVLSSIRAVTGDDSAPSVPVTPENALQALVVAALREGQSDAYIDALLNEAASRGDISVPRILVTAEGRVDTTVLLASIVAEAQIAAGGQAPLVPELVEGPGVEVRVVQTATETAQHRFYTVAPGDSLGAIALMFYGNSARYDAIFNANRMILSSPDLLRVGQRLVIPQI
ncbi:MAG: LysM peptidoglycan-binding domain-containing protein [Rhodobacterales bacterium]|nr:LysM peptidoglycan-binding domain-containing protein [Rhodobacterales bacterium]NCT13586.1 LysM peptidoglycan-binding domain-containing protein [Rhodobacterales bacterium]